MDYGFDKGIDRRGTHSLKWDHIDQLFGAKDILPMWVADMDFPILSDITRTIEQRAKHPVYGYTVAPDSLKQALAQWAINRWGWAVSGRDMLFTPGVVPALALSVLAFTRPGDKILIQPPVYPPFFNVVTKNHRELVQNPLIQKDGRYRIDFDHLRRIVDSSVKMLLFCNPHNPVGRVWEIDELSELAEFCVDHDILIVSDEIHADIIYGDHRHTPIASLGRDISERVITCTAPSKTFNIAGFSTSAVIIENQDLRHHFDQQLHALGLGSINTMGFAAAEAAYTHGEPWLDALLRYLELNANYLVSFIEEECPQLQVAMPEGTYLAWINMRGLGLDDATRKTFLVDHAKLGLNHGPSFGREGSGYERLNFACPRKTLEEGLVRLRTAVRAIRPT